MALRIAAALAAGIGTGLLLMPASVQAQSDRYVQNDDRARTAKQRKPAPAQPVEVRRENLPPERKESPFPFDPMTAGK
jgi:hypothetical protein